MTVRDVLYTYFLIGSIIGIGVLFPLYSVGKRNCQSFANFTNTETQYSLFYGCITKYDDRWIPVGSVRDDLELK